jgi:hypothetical protein
MMRVGEYLVVIENEQGRVVDKLAFSTHTGHPIRGDFVEIDERRFVVDRVVHVKNEDKRGMRTYNYAQVFVRQTHGTPVGPGPSGGLSEDKDSSTAGGRIISFRPREHSKDARLTSAILPVELVAILVACGYCAQAYRLKFASERVNVLARQGEAWVASVLSAEKLWAMRCEAKRKWSEALAVLDELSALRVTCDESPARALSSRVA